tara:strand:+ start:320 stop:631 length:312 start_codon:yes stop_codon:yes gene_type:complete
VNKVILEYPSSSGIKIYSRPNGSFIVRIPVSVTGAFASRKTLPTLSKAKDYAEDNFNQYTITNRGLKGLNQVEMSEIQLAYKMCKDKNVNLLEAVNYALPRIN